jgi:hypothetical protein
MPVCHSARGSIRTRHTRSSPSTRASTEAWTLVAARNDSCSYSNESSDRPGSWPVERRPAFRKSFPLTSNRSAKSAPQDRRSSRSTGSRRWFRTRIVSRIPSPTNRWRRIVRLLAAMSSRSGFVVKNVAE